MKLKEDYTLAKCCNPTEGDSITGYYSFDNFIKVHKSECPNVGNTDQSRLVTLDWPDIITTDVFAPESDYKELDEIDFLVMNHHKIYGVDYSLKVAAMLSVDKKAVFDSHKKLRSMNIIERVKALMIQYRKGIAKNKWIKHRNHTYYNLTDKGKKYLDYSKK
ncbi:MAG: DUF2250 domain-containing protein [candidate division Zixibacteria bacterium]|nr:DUF2250 domain-containing protein [candidate division Zixibacteria bacterium]